MLLSPTWAEQYWWKSWCKVNFTLLDHHLNLCDSWYHESCQHLFQNSVIIENSFPDQDWTKSGIYTFRLYNWILVTFTREGICKTSWILQFFEGGINMWSYGRLHWRSELQQRFFLAGRFKESIIGYMEPTPKYLNTQHHVNWGSIYPESSNKIMYPVSSGPPPKSLKKFVATLLEVLVKF